MNEDLDIRTYDILRLIKEEGPIGSINLANLMQQRGYSIKGRTIRLTLAELDEANLTKKIPGSGRLLTPKGEAELERGDVRGRHDQIRAQITNLATQVTYDPYENVGDIVVGAARIRRNEIDRALNLLQRFADSRFGPLPINLEDGPDDTIDLIVPSNITLDGVLLQHGIPSEMTAAGIVEYQPRRRVEKADEGPDFEDDRGGFVRYIDAISGETSSMDVLSLLIEAGRTNVDLLLQEEDCHLIVDNREIPINRFEAGKEIASVLRDALGGVVDLVRPRESGPFPYKNPGWDFASVTYAGVGENAIALLQEHDLLEDWDTLAGIQSCQDCCPATRLGPQHIP